MVRTSIFSHFKNYNLLQILQYSKNFESNHLHNCYIYRHFCECKPGFKAYQDPTKDGQTVCVDNNECELGTATCHQSTNCWNTQGSYQCYCQHANQTRCSKGIFAFQGHFGWIMNTFHWIFKHSYYSISLM